jgi:hypothetical protein
MKPVKRHVSAFGGYTYRAEMGMGLEIWGGISAPLSFLAIDTMLRPGPKETDFS